MDPGYDCAERLEGVGPNIMVIVRLKKRNVRREQTPLTFVKTCQEFFYCPL
jgi:hypothetical protein